jgi:hypothetical protein
MQSHQSPELEAMMDELSKQTERFTKMLYAGFDTEQEFWDCEAQIRQLQNDINNYRGHSTNGPKPFPLHGMIF